MTEDEAKTKWCPLVRNGASQSGISRPFATCIGSGCMMWRRADVQEHAWHSSINAPKGWHYTGNTRGAVGTGGQEQEYYRNVEGGYCGLAGKPS